MASRFKRKDGSRERTSVADRVIQIAILAIIAWGVFSAVKIAGNSDQAGGPMGGGPGGGPPGMSRQAESDDEAVAVETAQVSRGTVAEVIRINGDVVPSQSVTVYPDVDGKLIQLLVDEGDTVAAGAQIATVDPSTPGVHYANSPVLSTVAGTVTEIGADVGDTVSTSSELAVVKDLAQLELEIAIPERYVASAAVGMHAQVSVPAYPGELFDAQVSWVSPVVDSSSRTVDAKLALLEGDNRVLAGMFASVLLETKVSEDVVIAPISAISEYYGQSVVYVISEDGTARRQEIELGLESDETAEIVSGLEEGTEIVVAGLSNITDGATVRIVNGETDDEGGEG